MSLRAGLLIFSVVFAAVSHAQVARTNLGVLDSSQPISFFIQDGKDVPGYEPGDRDLAEMALAAWSRESGGKLRFVRSDNEKSALIHLVWITSGEGRFGETQRIIVDGKPGAVAFITPDIRQIGEPLASTAARDHLLRDTIVYLTCVHELGHAVGLGHTQEFADIMYTFTYGGDFVEYFSRYRRKLQSRSDIAKFSGLSAADAAALKSLY